MKQTKGRQTRDGAAVRRVQVMLDDDTIERTKALGDGNLSLGLRIAAREAYMRTLDQLVRDYSANAFVLADAGNGSSIGEKGRVISYTPEMAETYGSVRMEELDAMHESEDGIDCMFASGWIIVRQGDNPYRVRLFF
jgi:hypothetical protein